MQTTILACILLALIAIVVFLGLLVYSGKAVIRFKYDKTITTINKMDDMQLEIAKANLEELKKYNENAAKNSKDTTQALHSITAAAQAFMGVSHDETDRK